MNNFAWGNVVKTHTFKEYEIIEYYAFKFNENGHKIKGAFEEETLFHVDKLHESFPSYDIAVIGILVRYYQGSNSHLTYPIARMLEMEKKS